MLGAFAPGGRRRRWARGHDAVSGRRGRPGLEGQLRPDGHLDDGTANVALAVELVPTGWTRLAPRRWLRRRRRRRPARPSDATVRLDVSVPGDAAASTQTLRVIASLGGARDVLPISIRVDAAAAGDITITTTTPTLSGPSNGQLPVRPDPPQRHGPGRDGLGDGGRHGSSGLAGQGRDRRPGAGRLDRRRGRQHDEHQRDRDPAGERRRPATTASTSRSRLASRRSRATSGSS